MLAVGFQTTETLLRRIGHTEDANGVRTRFKYLQRMSFPAGTNTGRGKRATYDLDQLLQVLICFQLIQIGLPPTRALRTVRTGWPELRAPLAFGWLARGDQKLMERRQVLVMERSSLDDVTAGEDPNKPVSNPFRPLGVEAVATSLAAGEGDVLGLVLDPAQLASALEAAVGAEDIDVSKDDLESAFRAYWDDVAGGRLEAWTGSCVTAGAVVGEIVKFESRSLAAPRKAPPAAAG